VDLRNGPFGVAKAAQLAQLFVALPLQRSDIGAHRRKLTRSRDVVSDCSCKLDDDEHHKE
jgi:hypothetical protein